MRSSFAKKLTRTFLVLFCASLWVACGDDDPGTDAGGDTTAAVDMSATADSQTQGDSSTADSAVSDSTVTDMMAADLPPSVDSMLATDIGVSSAYKGVFNTLTLPADETEFARDLDGTGPKNQLGVILSDQLLTLAGIDFQSNVDGALTSGELTLLVELFADNLLNANPARLQVHLGEDADGNPANNYSGSGDFNFAANSPSNAFTDGTVTGGMYQGTGSLVVPLPLASGAAPVVNFEKAQMEGVLTVLNINNGVIAGAIPITQVNTLILPLIDSLVIDLYNNADALTKGLMNSFFDGNGNGTVEPGEVASSSFIQGLFIADIDTTGDGTPDAMSMGLGYTAITANF